MMITESRIVAHGFNRHSNWVGRSGRAYGAVSESLEQFAMNDGQLYLIAKGSHVLWVGSTDELVSDPMSRSRFRLALDCGERAFRLISPGAADQRLSTIWDLEGAVPQLSARVAA
ncbi:hypothetical protein [Devosia submarina]|uniref:hypothetical protein n=1 Tax=Devosia submarina TaxID=1173082 RepID=UPI000D356C13|nr:hypothetical protein [Devosia submarina]